MVKLSCAQYPNGEFYITTDLYKAVGKVITRRGEYHFTLSEKGQDGEWIYIATFSDTDFLRLIGDVCDTLVEYQQAADIIDADKQKAYRKPPL